MRTGIDIIEVARIEKLVERYEERFLGRVFTLAEIGYARGKRRPAEPLAARFAAKEAFIKAMGTRIPFNEIEIVMTGKKPSVLYRGRIHEGVSISHEREYAVALVVLEGEEAGDS